jgi:hypothetical protein
MFHLHILPRRLKELKRTFRPRVPGLTVSSKQPRNAKIELRVREIDAKALARALGEGAQVPV